MATFSCLQWSTKSDLQIILSSNFQPSDVASVFRQLHTLMLILAPSSFKCLLTGGVLSTLSKENDSADVLPASLFYEFSAR